jgi:Protein of unknown function (DUF4038)/Putative collagen-binding domain of a collagenase
MRVSAQPDQPTGSDGRLPRLRTNGHRLETRDTAQPFFWLADTAWELLQRLTHAEIDHYLEIRAAQGFNVIQVVGLSEIAELRANALGQTPLLEQNPRTPNPDYWTLLDWVLGRAERLGLYIALLPTWADKVTPGWGEGPVIFDPENARTYGAWLAERYANSSNLIFMLGGDRPAVYDGDQFAHGDWRAIWRGMAAGILEHSPEALITYHTAGGVEHRTGLSLHDEPWLAFNTMQSGHGGGQDTPVWDWISEDRQRKPAKPTLDAEVNYEDHPVNPWPSYDPANGYFRDHDVRKQCWRGVLAGAAGVTYGHHAVWQYHAPGRENINLADRTWFEAMHRPGAIQVGIMRRWLEAFLPLFEPAQEVIRSALGEGASHVRAARDPEWRRLAIYVPNSQTLRIHLEPLAGERVNASWFDPRSGQTQAIGVFPAMGERLFSTPLSAPDWVLALEVTGDQ